MYEFENGVRYPLVATDEAGYVLFSYPEVLEKDECYFAPSNFSSEEISFLHKRIKEHGFGNLILLKERKNGKAVFVSPYLFPTARALVAIASDIDFDIAAAICSFSHKDIVISERYEDKLGKRHEKVYENICNIIYALKNSAGVYSHEKDFHEHLSAMVNAVSYMTFCRAKVNFEPAYSMPCPDNFDSAFLGFYLIIMMSAASFASSERSAIIDLSMRADSLCVKLSFSAIMDKAVLTDFEEKFSSAVSMLDSLCAKNNLPMYFYRDGVFRSGIIPCRIENSLLGLKARIGFLKDEKQEEQKERNIFLSPFSSDK